MVTGSSAGMEKATAILLAQNGYTLDGATHRMEKMHVLSHEKIESAILFGFQIGEMT